MDSLKWHFPWEKKTYIFRLIIKCFYKCVILLLNDYGVNKYVFIILRYGHSARRGHAYMGRGKGRGAGMGGHQHGQGEREGCKGARGAGTGREKGRGTRGAGARRRMER